MPPIFKGINPFKWGSDERQYIYDQNDLGKEKLYQFQKPEPRSSKTTGGDLNVSDSKKCRHPPFPSHYHQIDCPLFRASCPVHSGLEYSEPTVTISFHPSDRDHKLLVPVKSILAGNSKRIKLRYYLPRVESDVEVFRKPLLSGPIESNGKKMKIKDDSDIEKQEKFLRNTDLITVKKEKGNQTNTELKKEVKNDQFAYYAAADQLSGKKAANVCIEKNCPCAKTAEEGLKNDEEGSNTSIYFSPYMLINEDDPPKKNKICCSCLDIDTEKKCPQRKKSESKVNINFQFGNFNGKEFKVATEKNLVQVLIPEKEEEKDDFCPCPAGKDNARSLDSNKIEEKKGLTELHRVNQQPREEPAKESLVPVLQGIKTNKFAETQTENKGCPVCAAKNLKEAKTEIDPPVRPKPRKIHPTDRNRQKSRMGEVSRMNLDNFQTRKKLAWEKNEYDCPQSSRLGSDGLTSDCYEYSATESEGRSPCIVNDCPASCKPCRAYQIYVTKTPEPNHLALKNIFPCQNYFPKEQNDKKEFQNEKPTIGDFDDLLQIISEKFSMRDIKQEPKEIKKSEPSNTFEKDNNNNINNNNFIDIFQYRQALKAEKKNSVKSMLILPTVPMTENIEKVPESKEYNSLTNISQNIGNNKESTEKCTMTSDAEKLISDDEMVTLHIKVSKNKR